MVKFIDYYEMIESLSQNDPYINIGKILNLLRSIWNYTKNIMNETV